MPDPVTERPRRLDQLLSSCGYCSRRECRGWLRRHAVTVAGQPVRTPELKVLASTVVVDGEPLDHPDGMVVLFHKPVGVVCSHDAREGPSIYELLPARWQERNPAVNSVGRLDKDASGLLVLTDVGHLVQYWTSPRHHVPKLYEVELDREADPAWVELFASGTMLLAGEDKPCAPAVLELAGGNRVRLELTEGRFHQVKRMFAGVGALVAGLHRTRFGPFELGDLEPGKWKVVGDGGMTGRG